MLVVISTIDVFFAANNQILWIFQRKMCAHGISWRRNEFRRVVYFSVSLGLHSKIISSNCKSDSIFCSSIFKPTISRENVPSLSFHFFSRFFFLHSETTNLIKSKSCFFKRTRKQCWSIAEGRSFRNVATSTYFRNGVEFCKKNYSKIDNLAT